MRIAMVGGGIIGLACAWRLACEGVDVTLFDAATEAREASWAAAGMLAPHHEYDHDSPLWRFGRAGLDGWPAFLVALGVTPEDVDFHRCHGLIPILDASDEREANARERFLCAMDVACRRLNRATLPAILAPDITAGLAIPAAHVNPRLVTAVLRQRCAALGVHLRYDDPVIGLSGTTVSSTHSTTTFDHVVLASGAWTPALATLADLPLRGEPIKGQLLRFATANDVLQGFIHSRHAYIVPRRDHGVVIGATMVDSGFDKRQDDSAIAALATAARRLLPELAHAAIVETWTGLRPRLSHGLPVIANPRPGMTVATGHFRNGILLTPITADCVAALVLGKNPPCALSAFGIP